MQPAIHPVNRWCVAPRVRRCSPQFAIDELLNGRNVHSDFVHTATRMPAYDQTRFHVCTDGKRLQVAIVPFNMLGERGLQDSIELFFDPYHDHLGFFQFIFVRGQEPIVMHHLPYPDAASTAFPWMHVIDHTWHDVPDVSFMGFDVPQQVLVVNFDVSQTFRQGESCGFNVARNRTAIVESSSWNLCSGNGLVDATSFGNLYLKTPPAHASITNAQIDGTALTLAGDLTGETQNLTLELADPLDRRTPITVRRKGGAWRATGAIDSALAGRYRVYPKIKGQTVEPECFAFDVTPAESQPFAMGMFYDIPDDLRCGHFTPQRLDSQLETLGDWGINRLYWIHYGRLDRNRAWWADAGEATNTRKTVRACGDILSQAVELAHQRGMEIFGTFKPFDMGWTWPLRETRAPDRIMHVVKGFSPVLDVVADNQDLTMRRNEAWHQPWSLPITRLVLRSEEPLARLRASDVQLWVSKDNHTYRPYRGAIKLRQISSKVPHNRWTPAGIVEEPGQRPQWEVELVGLKLDQPYLAIELAPRRREGWRCKARRFLFAQGFDAKGQPMTPLLADAGSRDKGFHFASVWPGWANQTDKVLDHFSWTGGPLAMALTDLPAMSVMLEPTYAQARQVWLGFVEELLDLGVDGVDIRILCHHNVCHAWLTYAFAPSVLAIFRERFGRDPNACEDDYQQIRLIRGEALTQFLRDAKALTRARGKKLAIHLECGAEVPNHLNTRMQMHLDWRRWIEEGIADELTGKYWGSQNPWIHEEVLPLARKHNVPMHLCDMNFTLNQVTGIERAARLATEARAAGFAGFAWYETVCYLKMNAAGMSLPLAHADKAISHAAEVLKG